MAKKFDLDNPKLPEWIRKGAMRSGGYPYADELNKNVYGHRLKALQIELVKLQSQVQATGARIAILVEGRDAAGKGGTIARYLENLNHRSNRIVALSKPTEVERSQWYFQRFVATLPSAGEQVLFDRSWYNRAGVEPVMGFCTQEETEHFLDAAPAFERMLVEDGIRLFKFWLNIGREMQLQRFHERRHDPLKAWKLSPIDLGAIDRFDAYTKARNLMFARTHTGHAPWIVIRANDRRRARLGAIQAVLSGIDYPGREARVIGKIDRKIVQAAPDFLKTATNE
ncbi:MAG: polyphosphate kinase 2 [Cucumibacter sp.]